MFARFRDLPTKNPEKPEPTTSMALVSTDRYEGQLDEDERPHRPAESREDSIRQSTDDAKV